MEKNKINDLKQELMDIVAKTGKEKTSVSDVKIVSESVSIQMTIKDVPVDYMDVLLKVSSEVFGYKPAFMSDLKGEK